MVVNRVNNHGIASKMIVITIVLFMILVENDCFADQLCFKREQNIILYDEVHENRAATTLADELGASDEAMEDDGIGDGGEIDYDNGGRGSFGELDVPTTPSTTEDFPMWSEEATLEFWGGASTLTHTGDADSLTAQVTDRNGQSYGLDLNNGSISVNDSTGVWVEIDGDLDEYFAEVYCSSDGDVTMHVLDRRKIGTGENVIVTDYSSYQHYDDDEGGIEQWAAEANETYGIDTATFIEMN
ncbi:MAG: hypothetical protein K9L78_00365 [Victivallales bacterium]|nr:hypothetical protein [Victivallales bacterium]